MYSIKKLECNTIKLICLEGIPLRVMMIKTISISKKNSTKTDETSKYFTQNLWSMKITKLKESAPQRTHLNKKKKKYVLV